METLTDFDQTITFWIAEIDRYTFEQLCLKPGANQWSLGQVCMHLLEDTGFYIDQINVCLGSNDHSDQTPTQQGQFMLDSNEFPDEVIEGAPSNAFVPQPASKQRLLLDLVNLQSQMRKLKNAIDASVVHGRAKHPGLGYFNATQWHQFAGMHFRHHLRQKLRIDKYLQGKEAGNTRAQD